MAVFMTLSMDCTVVAYLYHVLSATWNRYMQHRIYRGVRVPYINNSAEGANSIRSIYGVGAASRVFHDGAGDHDDVLGRAGKLLDDKMDHLPKTGIFVLEELGDTEEESRGFICRELVAGVEEQGDLGQEDATPPGLDWRAVEEAGCGGLMRVSVLFLRW